MVIGTIGEVELGMERLTKVELDTNFLVSCMLVGALNLSMKSENE